MPYLISQGGGTCGDSQYAVLSESGATMGCHGSKAEAKEQLAALYANEPDASKSAGSEIPAPHAPVGRMMASRHAPTSAAADTTRHTTAAPRHTTRARKP
jgi:hypothetical protein